LAKTQAHAAKGTIFSVYGKTFVYKEKELRTRDRSKSFELEIAPGSESFFSLALKSIYRWRR